MMPIGPLMIEHRLIDRMVDLARKRLDISQKEGIIDPLFVNTLVDFFRTYADRCHHGKEEDILFRDLNNKSLPPAHRNMMNELIADHRWGRATVGRLNQANSEMIKGDDQVYPIVIEHLESLLEFYPRHIEKEDKHFFIPIMEYFSNEEKEALLEEEYIFDKGLIHKIYGDIVEKLEE